jgi:hypothetical protein
MATDEKCREYPDLLADRHPENHPILSPGKYHTLLTEDFAL